LQVDLNGEKMKGTLKPRIKICCIGSVQEAKMAIELGASALGLVGNMPSGPGIISDDKIAEIVRIIPPLIASFLLTSETDAEKIIMHQKRVGTNTIQIVDKLQTGTYEDIRFVLNNIKLVQVIHVLDESSIDEAIAVSQYVDAVLLDSGNPNLKVKKLGGTGKIHNWEISKIIRQKLDIPIFLAGGINPDNITKAIHFVQPFGIDICNGVRTNGKLNECKLGNLFKIIETVRAGLNN
jgi:phosphoribosylanthranilate isomerase